MPRSIDGLFGPASSGGEELDEFAGDSGSSEDESDSSSEYNDSSAENSDESQLQSSAASVVTFASPAANAPAAAIVAVVDDDDDDVQILTAAEAAAEVAAAARRAVENPSAFASRKRKRPLVETKAEATECTICCEDCTLIGRHRLVALRCGHLFGKKCIERWISEKRTCPNCSAGVRRTDICPLFSDHVAVVDNSGLEDMTAKFETEKKKTSRLETEVAALKKQLQSKTKEVTRLNRELTKFKKFFADHLENKRLSQVAAPATPASGQAVASAALVAMAQTCPGPRANFASGEAAVQVTQSQPASQGASSSSQVPQPCGALLPVVPTPSPPAERDVDALTAAIGNYKPVFDVPLQSARVFSIDHSCLYLCVGEKLGQASHGIMMLTVADPSCKIHVPVHSSDVRDLCIQRLGQLVLTVAFDGKLAVTSLRDLKVAVQVELPPGRRQGWSCSFSELDPYAMFCGFQDGTVAKYDMRKPATGEQGIVKNFSLPERQPVHSLKLFKSHEWSTTEGLAAATFRGLSIWRDVAQVASDANLPVVGNGSVAAAPFCHATSDQACYSLASSQLTPSQMVASARSTPTKHSLFNLRTIGSGHLAPAMEFIGHNAPSVLSRSAMWSEADGTSVVASWSHDIESVTLWDVATLREARGPDPTSLSVASSAMPVVDIQHAAAYGSWASGNALFGTMTSRQLCVYSRDRGS